MAIVSVNDRYLSDIAYAIRAKNGLSNTYKPREMAAAIEKIQVDGAKPYMIPYELKELPACIFKNDISEDYLEISDVTFDKYISPSGAAHNLTTIGKWAFFGQRMSKIDLPETVTTIADDAFDNCCASQVRIIMRGTNLVNPHCFNVHNAISNTKCDVYLYVPRAILDQANLHYGPYGYLKTIAAIEDNPSICG